MGYDSIVGVSMVFVAAGLGFAGAVLNPFTIGIAQGIADLPLFSGFGYRMFCWIVINIVGISWVLWYAHKIKKDPKKSPVYQTDEYWRNQGAVDIETFSFYTPKSAWVSFIVVSIGLVVFSWIYPSSEIKIGNASSILPAIPLATGLFVLSGFFALRKSVHFYILNLLAFTIVFLIIGVMGYSWYIMEIATLFFALGIFSGIAMNYNGNKITNYFLVTIL